MTMRRERLIMMSCVEAVLAAELILRCSELVSRILVLVMACIFAAVVADCGIGLHQMRAIREQKDEEEKRRIQAELDQKRQKLQALESQINPHFLYNTLDTFRGLALEQGNRELSDMIEALSQMFKYSVKYEAEMVNINAELDYLKHYIQLQQMRFPGRFTYEEHLECDPANLLLEPCPRFVLQPIVENAIRHGLRDIRKGGHIIVTMGIRRRDFFILVEDNGCGMDMTEVSLLNQRLSQPLSEENVTEGEEKAGIGIENVNRRIKMFCGEEYGLRISSNLGTGTQVEVSLPLYREALEEKVL